MGLQVGVMYGFASKQEVDYIGLPEGPKLLCESGGSCEGGQKNLGNTNMKYGALLIN